MSGTISCQKILAWDQTNCSKTQKNWLNPDRFIAGIPALGLFWNNELP